jgi:hypothetical protein
MRSRGSPTVVPVTRGMRRMLFVASGLVFTVGIQLFLLTDHTDRYFAWTINPPLTAASLGAAYWASFVLELLAAREREWSRARIAVPAVLLFTTLTLATTILHLDRFHLHAPNKSSTIVATWAWILVYAAVPPVMFILLIRQMREPGAVLQRRAPLAAWIRALFATQAIVMLALGIALFTAPGTVASAWPWGLTPLTGRAIGAWLLGLGVAAAQSSWENDAFRIRAATASCSVLSCLELVALARYRHTIAWGAPRAWIYLAFLVSLLVAGVCGLIPVWRAGCGRAREIRTDQQEGDVDA